MKQSKFASAVEVISGTLLGLLIAGLTNWLILPFWGFASSIKQSFEIGFVFTAISLIRGWILRRVFEWLRTTGVLP